MAKVLTKSAVISYIAEAHDLPKKTVNELFDTMSELAYKEAKKNGTFVLPGFGKLVLMNRKARIGRNPQTGEAIKIPAKKVVKFRVAKSVKDAIVPPKKVASK